MDCAHLYQGCIRCAVLDKELSQKKGNVFYDLRPGPLLFLRRLEIVGGMRYLDTAGDVPEVLYNIPGKTFFQVSLPYISLIHICVINRYFYKLS